MTTQLKPEAVLLLGKMIIPHTFVVGQTVGALGKTHWEEMVVQKGSVVQARLVSWGPACLPMMLSLS